MARLSKTYLYLIAFLGATSSCWALTPVATQLPETTTKPLIIADNQKKLVVRLTANPTTGFKWFLKNYDARYLTPIAHQYLPPQNIKLIGAPGIETFTFLIHQKTMNVPQTGTLDFIYARPWEALPKQDTILTWIHE
jgi:predicted secreted protein